MSIRVIVIGGQFYDGREHIYRTLDALHSTIRFGLLIECNMRARLGDQLVGTGYHATRWAGARGVLTAHQFPESSRDKTVFGKAVERYRPEVVIRFPGGKLTNHFAEQAAERRMQIVEAL